MKNPIIASCLGMIITGAAFAQPVSDRAVVPVAVTLNQILRLHVVNGGNVEFVFNTIDQYKNGIAYSASADNETDFVVASSTNWSMMFGAEDANLMPTDQALPLTAFDLLNIGVQVVDGGLANTVTDNGGGGATETGAPYSDAVTAPNGLAQYPQQLLIVGTGNAGDVSNDNAFSIQWSCGLQPATGAGTATLGTSILSQNLTADRYVTNVLFDIDPEP